MVTGAAGFIGARLGNRLAELGHDVVGVDLSAADRTPGFDLRRMDFRDHSAVRPLLDRSEVVFHLAAAHLDLRLSSSEYRDVNANSLRPLLKSAAAAGVRLFLHVSSVGVYGDLGDWPADETSPCRPESLYGITKLEGERIVAKSASEFGIPFEIFRPAWVYGSTCPRTRKIIDALRSGRFVMIGAGRNRRHPIFVEDAVEAMIRGMEREEAAGETLILGGPEHVTSRELIETICGVFGFRPPAWTVPYAAGLVAAAAVEKGFRFLGRQPPVSRRTLEFFRTDNAFDTTRAENVLGFRPATTLREGMEVVHTALNNAA